MIKNVALICLLGLSGCAAEAANDTKPADNACAPKTGTAIIHAVRVSGDCPVQNDAVFYFGHENPPGPSWSCNTVDSSNDGCDSYIARSCSNEACRATSSYQMTWNRSVRDGVYGTGLLYLQIQCNDYSSCSATYNVTVHK